jgi:hypothetical protein
MLKRHPVAALVLALVATAAPVAAGAFEDQVRARWRGAWVLTDIESYSTCNGKYFNNDVSGQFVAARAGRKFEPGELAKVDQLQVRRKKIELMITVATSTLLPYQDGPFTLYAERTCQIELEVAIPREMLKTKDVEDVDRILDRVAQRFSTEDEAIATSSWNGREADEYPQDYQETVARHAVWRAEETNRHIDSQIEKSLVVANELAREIDGSPGYLAGLAAGSRQMREWRERDCNRLVGSTAVTFRFSAPDEYRDNSSWCAGYYDGQALVYHLAIVSRLPACYVDVPELPADFADNSYGQR